MICLDTNVVIAFLNGTSAKVMGRLTGALQAGEVVAISAIVVFELRYGAARSGRPDRNGARIDEFLSGRIAVLPFEADDAREAGEIRAELARIGRPTGPYDILIAAQARRRGAILVTANEREFVRVPGLTVEDWSIPSG